MTITRRNMLITGAGLTGVALAASAQRTPALPLDLTSPESALNAYIKLRGSTAKETVYQAYEGDIFLVADGQVGIPLAGFRGIQKSHWQPHPEGGYVNQDYDVGVYVDYETRVPLDIWTNPLTGRTVDVVHYRGGPSGGHFRVNAEEADVYSNLSGGRWTTLGNQLWHTSSNWGRRSNPLQPDDWPLASAGESILGSMSLSFAGRVDEVVDPELHQVPALQLWTNSVSWMPWMEMGQRPGFNLWRWVGAKGIKREELASELVTAVEAIWPGYVSNDSVWKVPTSGRRDYMRIKRGLQPTS